MRLKFLLISFLLVAKVNAQLSWQSGMNPYQTDTATLRFDATGTSLAGAAGTLYAHMGVTLSGTPWQLTIGTWGNNQTQPALERISGNQYRLRFSSSINQFFRHTSGGISAINIVVRNAAVTAQSADLSIPVRVFDMTLTSPVVNNSTHFTTSNSVSVNANHVGGGVTYTLLDPAGQTLQQLSSGTQFGFNLMNPANGAYTLRANLDNQTITRRFFVVRPPTLVSAAVPAGMQDGVNYLSNDSTQVVLVLNAPGKDFVAVAGSHNNWQPTDADFMRRDPSSGRFWITISNLTPNQWYAFQYWVCDETPAVNSPNMVRTADPFSTLVLSPFDDPEIIQLGVYPGLPDYNTIAPLQEREVSVIQTGHRAYWQYQWKSTGKANQKIDRKDLIIYEAFIRDFDANRTYQDLINRLDYFKTMRINAIQLMPVMEFEGNMSWGYNPVYHMAPDKRYGSPAKLKEFIDSCHANNIAVIFDLALNHVFGRSPLARMWMVDADRDGWPDAISPDNPYCHVEPKHTLNVGFDLNHFREPDNLTNTYVFRTVREWMNEYRVDGFRWDLTQGITNACSPNDANCTHSNQSDRIVKLKWYADMQWNIDPNFYVIFEHWVFGEIPEYTNYRLNETPSKGIICWRRGDEQYANLIKGNATDISQISDPSTYRIQGNMESHDEERLAYKAITEAGQTVGNLSKVHARMPALGPVFFLVPGPKMIWHFGELGNEVSVNTCEGSGIVSGNCRLDTKPQPHWVDNWLGQPARRKIYDDWSRLIRMRVDDNLFRNGQFSFNQNLGTGMPRLDVWTSTTPTNYLSYAFVHTNFTNSPVTRQAFFPYTGTWYNLMDNTPIQVTSVTQNITLPADGGYVVFGNRPISEFPTYITRQAGDWNNPNTWQGLQVPPASAGVIILHAVQVSQDTQVRSVQVESTGSVNVQAGRRLDILK
jgi:glycosidase